MLRVAEFDPRERAIEKQMAREEDARALLSHSASAEEINQRNGLFSKADLVHAEIVGRRKAVLMR